MVNTKNNAVVISVDTSYIDEQSDEAENRYVFSYTITIKNNTNEQIQLLSRHWTITDANGEVSTVVGEGVVGKQPKLAPNQSFTYTSGSIFKTPVGTMQGHYLFINEDKQSFQTDIPVFRLALPNILN